jgi:hypothetical protein
VSTAAENVTGQVSSSGPNSPRGSSVNVGTQTRITAADGTLLTSPPGNHRSVRSRCSPNTATSPLSA